MVTMVSHMACGNEPMLSRGSTIKISAAKTRVSISSEKRQIGRASTHSSKAQISSWNRSKRRIVFMSRRTGTNPSSMFLSMSCKPSSVPSGTSKFTVDRSTRGVTAAMSMRLCQSRKKVRWLGHTRKRKSSSRQKTPSTVTSRAAEDCLLKIGGSTVCRSATTTEAMMKRDIQMEYQPATLLDSGSSRNRQTLTGPKVVLLEDLGSNTVANEEPLLL
mmetsp:Transcript_7688/g.24478  ORF Transcript_7688/g.24478 Transcript_7688/m.24478 type:complete len:217 (-) Transcript_7688:272-922(-)